MGAVAQKTMEKFTQIAETEITEKGLHSRSSPPEVFL